MTIYQNFLVKIFKYKLICQIDAYLGLNGSFTFFSKEALRRYGVNDKQIYIYVEVIYIFKDIYNYVNSI